MSNIIRALNFLSILGTIAQLNMLNDLILLVSHGDLYLSDFVYFEYFLAGFHQSRCEWTVSHGRTVDGFSSVLR